MNNFPDRALIGRIEQCYQKLSGKPLPGPDNLADRAWWLHDKASYSLLAHDGGDDPHFIYANECALRCFKYSREEMLRLPSRLSAAGSERQERQQMLDGLTTPASLAAIQEYALPDKANPSKFITERSGN